MGSLRKTGNPSPAAHFICLMTLSGDLFIVKKKKSTQMSVPPDANTLHNGRGWPGWVRVMSRA